MEITAIVITALVGLLTGSLVALALLRRNLEAKNSKLVDVLYMLDDVIYKIVLGIEQMGLKDPLLEKGEAKLAKALEMVEAALNVIAGFNISFDEDAVAKELVRTWVEGVVSLMNERKSKEV